MDLVTGRACLSSANLTDQHIRVLAYTYHDGMTQDEIGAELKLKQPRISKLLSEALNLLRKAGLSLPRERPQHRLRFYDPQVLERLCDR
jgi:DNA-binding MarR family transcriptional regulator